MGFISDRLEGITPTTQPTEEYQPQGFWKAIDYLNRLNYASAGMALKLSDPEVDDLIEVGKAGFRGLVGKERHTYSDVLTNLGWDGQTLPEKIARGTIGFALDVALDPITYIGIGALTKVGKTAKLAPTIGAQAKLGQRALVTFGRRPLIKAPKAVEAIGKFGRYLAEGEKGIAKLTSPVIQKMGKTFFTKFKPKGITPENWKVITRSIDEAKNILGFRTGQATKFTQDIFDDLQKVKGLKDFDFADFITASEKALVGDYKLLKKLPEGLQPIARKFSAYSRLNTAIRKKVGKGILSDEEIGYAARILKPEFKEGAIKIGKGAEFAIKSPEDVFRGIRKFTDRKTGKALITTAKELRAEPIEKGSNIYKVMVGKDKGKFYLSGQATFKEIKTARIKLKKAPLFIEEPEKISFIMGARAGKAEASKHFFEGIKPLGATKYKEGLVEGTDVLKGRWFSKEVASEINKTTTALTDDETMKGIIKSFDTVQNFWKGQVLISPAYHARNIIGNMWNNYLGEVTKPALYKTAKDIQMLAKTPSQLKNIIITTKAGKKITGTQIFRQAERTGVLGRGWYAADIDKVINRYGKYNLTKANRAVGEVLENNARLAHFIDKIEKGSSFFDASQSVKKYLFDYGELTKFEKQVMKRVAPFYTWTRKNIPLQIENLIKQPGKFAALGKAKEAIETEAGVPATEKYLPEWIKGRAPIRIRKNPKGQYEYFLLENWLPAADIDKILKPGKTFGEMFTPIIKTPYEFFRNWSTYFNSKIERYPGERQTYLGMKNAFTRKKLVMLYRNIRILNDFEKLNPGSIFGTTEKESIFGIKKTARVDLPVFARIVNFLTGVKLQPYDLKRAKKSWKYKQRTTLSELMQGYNKAKKGDDTKEKNRLAKLIAEVKAK